MEENKKEFIKRVIMFPVVVCILTVFVGYLQYFTDLSGNITGPILLVITIAFYILMRRVIKALYNLHENTIKYKIFFEIVLILCSIYYFIKMVGVLQLV